MLVSLSQMSVMVYDRWIGGMDDVVVVDFLLKPLASSSARRLGRLQCCDVTLTLQI